MHSAVRSKFQKSAEGFTSRAGYKAGGAVDPDAVQDKAMVAKGVHQHESAMHKGVGKTKLALKSGGRVEGFASGGRLDKPGRRGNVNVIVNAGGDKEAAAKEGLQKGIKIGAVMGAQAVAAKLGGGAGGPPGGPAAQAGAPPMPAPSGGGAPMPTGGGMKRGGRIPDMTAGAEGGAGRIEKANAYGGGHIRVREHMRRRNGGAI